MTDKAQQPYGVLSRRTALKSLAAAGIAGGGIVTGSMLSRPVAAESHLELDLSDSPTVDTDDGALSYVATGLQGMLHWQHFGHDMASFDWVDTVVVEVVDEGVTLGPHTIYSLNDELFGPFDQAEDTADASGRDGHITFHVSNPDGHGFEFSGGVQGEHTSLTGPTWAIVQDQAFREASHVDELGYDAPSAVDPGYELPHEPIHAEDLEAYFPDDGQEQEFSFFITREVTMYNETGSEAFIQSGSGQFSVTVKNVDGDVESIGVGGARAGPGLDDRDDSEEDE